MNGSIQDMNRHGYVEAHEEQEAKALIWENLGFEPPEALGDHMIVKLYVRPEEISTIKTNDGREVKLFLPDMVRANDKFRNAVALVIAMGPACYGPDMHCRIGDFVMIPRNEGTQFSYKGWTLHFLKYKKYGGPTVYCRIKNPQNIARNMGD
jgi:hypothetical protein